MTTKTKAVWTRPWCGVTHLDNVQRPRQATVEDHGTLAEAVLFDFSRNYANEPNFPDFTVARKMFRGQHCGTRAKRWLERLCGLAKE